MALVAGLESAAGAAPCVCGEVAGDASPPGDVAGEAAAGVGVSSDTLSRTERLPLTPSESVKAMSIKEIAAPMVILASSVCVPRGPKAVLETELVKSAPASALPGCRSTARINVTHAKIKKP